MLVTHTCNPSYSGGRDQEDLSSKPPWTVVHKTLFFLFFCGTGAWTQGFHLESPHQPSFLWYGFFNIGSRELIAQAGFKLWSSSSLPPKKLWLQVWANGAWCKTLSWKCPTQYRAGRIAQVAEYLPANMRPEFKPQSHQKKKKKKKKRARKSSSLLWPCLLAHISMFWQWNENVLKAGHWWLTPCNPSDSRGRDQEDHRLKSAWSNSSLRPYLEKPLHKKGLAEWLKVKALSSNHSTAKK
jgi:hypothetical protein